jgi:hypothetical protein
MGVGGLVTGRQPPLAGKRATGRSATGGGHFGARTPAIGGRHTTRGALRKHYGKGKGKGKGRGRGRAKATTTGYQAPDVKKIETKAEAPKELTGYMEDFRTDVLGGHKGRLEELREKGGAFMEEAGRQGRESTTARIEEARQRAAEQGVPFDEQAAMREALQEETGARAEGLQGAEDRIDRALGAQTAAYQGGLPIMQAPSQAAMGQKAQSLAEQQALMDFWLGKESAATARASVAAQEQAAWFDRMSSMMSTVWA